MLFQNGFVNEGGEGLWDGWGTFPIKANLEKNITSFMFNELPPRRYELVIVVEEKVLSASEKLGLVDTPQAVDTPQEVDTPQAADTTSP